MSNHTPTSVASPCNKSNSNSPIINSRKNSISNSVNSPGRRKTSFVERTSAAIEAKFSPNMLRKSSSNSVNSIPASPVNINDDIQYSMLSTDYEIGNPIGYGSSAVVYIAKYKPLNKNVAIKMIDLDMFERNQIDELRREIQIMSLCKHPNLLTVFGSFVFGSKLYIVTPYLSAGSCLNLMKYAHPDGFEELVIATILKQALLGLDYLHKSKLIHRDVKAGNLLIDEDGLVRLADFGVSSSLMETGERKGLRKTFVGTPCWMAPEVMEQSGYDYKADIWSFGITSLELATGHAPFAKYPPIKVLMLTLQNEPPTLDRDQASHKFSKSFKEMIDSCLIKDPQKRPTSEKLLQHTFFKQAKKKSYLVQTILNNVPPLTQITHIKKTPQPKVSHEKGISWDFDCDTSKNINPEENVNANENNVSSESLSEVLSNESSKPMSPELSNDQISKSVKFNEDSNAVKASDQAMNELTNNNNNTNQFPKKSRFIVDSDSISSSINQNNSTSNFIIESSSVNQSTEIKKGRFSLLESSVDDKKGRFEVQTSPTISCNDLSKHGRFTVEANGTPVDSQKQINDKIDFMLRQSERQYNELNELISVLSIKANGQIQSSKQDTVSDMQIKNSSQNVLETITTLNNQIQSLIEEVDVLQRENDNIKSELQEKNKINEQLQEEIDILKKKNDEIRSNEVKENSNG